MIEVIVLSFFTAFVLYEDINLSARIKILFKVPLRKNIQVLDCFPCFTFWISVATTIILHQEYYTPMLVFITAKFYEIWKSN